MAQLKAVDCHKIYREKISAGDVAIVPAVDRLSRDTTDLAARSGAGLRSLAEPVVDTTWDFAELVLAMLGVAAKLERRRIMEPWNAQRAGGPTPGPRA